MLKPYQKKRLTTFINPEADPLGDGYNVIQSKIALGSCGFWGKGLGNGTQTRLHFLPEYHTDFIFSSLGEQLGFIGCFIVLTLLLLLIIRSIFIAMKCKNFSGTLIIAGIITMFFTHILINVGMSMGLLPVTGLPLCFISYGGTAIISNLITIGLLLNINSRRYK